MLDLDAAPRDPWGNEYRLVPGAGRRTEIASAGPDGSFDTDDDLCSRPGPGSTADVRADGSVLFTRSRVTELQKAVDSYVLEKGVAVESWKPLLTKDAAGFRALDRDEPPRDPWGNEYHLVRADGGRSEVV